MNGDGSKIVGVIQALNKRTVNPDDPQAAQLARPGFEARHRGGNRAVWRERGADRPGQAGGRVRALAYSG